MGEAYMFAEDDPSLLGYNPAGITRLQGSWFSGGISYINPRGRVDFHGGSADGAVGVAVQGDEGDQPDLFARGELGGAQLRATGDLRGRCEFLLPDDHILSSGAVQRVQLARELLGDG